MALRNIFVDGDPILRKTCRPVEKFDEKLNTLIDDMHETLERAEGVGLAAPQVGMCKRLFVMNIDDEKMEFINPSIISKGGRQRIVEGCLSCPDKWGYVTRPKRVVIKAQNRNGEWFERSFSDLAAQCFCHEYAHLDGQLFTDIVEEYVDPDEVERQREGRRRGARKYGVKR